MHSLRSINKVFHGLKGDMPDSMTGELWQGHLGIKTVQKQHKSGAKHLLSARH